MKLTFELISKFCSDIFASPKTKEGYKGELLRFKEFLGDREISNEAVREYLSFLLKKGLSNRTISRAGYAIKRLFKYLYIEPKFEIPSLEFGPPSKVIEESDVLKLIEAGRTPLEKALPALLYDGGLRISEALGINLEDINFEDGTLKVRRKGRRGRVEEIAIFPSTLKLIKEYKEWAGIKKGPLFPYSYHELRRMLIAQAERAKVTFPKYSLFHNLRHCRARTLRKAGVDIADISDALGHTSLTTTLKLYSRLAPQPLLQRLRPPPW